MHARGETNELTEQEIKEKFTQAHLHLYNTQKSKFGGFFRSTKLRYNSKILDIDLDLLGILKHAMKANNRSRQVFVSFGWLDETGKVTENAPFILKNTTT